MGRYLAATAFGRFPRYFAYALLGEILQVPTLWLFGMVVGGALITVAWRYFRHVVGRKTSHIPEA